MNDIQLIPASYATQPAKGWFANYSRFLQTVCEGYKNLVTKKIVICICCRDIESKSSEMFVVLKTLCKLCLEMTVLFYENDSKDNTVEQLNRWCNENENSHLFTQQSNSPKFGSTFDKKRVENMATVRNNLLNKVKADYMDYDYMIVMDADLWFIPIDGIASSFGHQDWDVMSANGLGCLGFDKDHEILIYYDIWSLVEKGDHRHYKSGHKPFLPHTGLFQVESGFGGFAIYRLDPRLKDCHYNVVHYEEEPQDKSHPYYLSNRFSDEHVGLHFDMAKVGLNQMYINTGMTLLRCE